MVAKVGFVSLGCPKALVDSELILTQLSAEGYETAKDYAGADLVIVNTCGFIDSAVEESLSAIGEALTENGKVIVTGCLGAKKNADGTAGQILGVHMVGPWVTEQLSGGYLAVNWEATAAEVAEFIQPHPSLTELFGETVLSLTGRSLNFVTGVRTKECQDLRLAWIAERASRGLGPR